MRVKNDSLATKHHEKYQLPNVGETVYDYTVVDNTTRKGITVQCKCGTIAIEGNVQWVHKDINKMKVDFEQPTFIQLCELVVTHNQKTKPLTETGQ